MKRILALFLAVVSVMINTGVYANADMVYKTKLYNMGDEVTFIIEVEGTPSLVDKKLKSGFSLNSITKDIVYDQDKVLSAIKDEVSGEVKEGYTYTSLFNGFSLEGNESQLEAIKNVDGVKNVYVSRKIPFKEPKLYASGEYTGVNTVDDYGYSGKGQAIAVIDAFCDVNHEMFQGKISDPKFSKSDIEKIITDKKLNVTNGVYVNEKFPFVYNYASNETDVSQYETGHGTHVSGIAAGNNGKITDESLNREVTVKGVAPDAQIVFMNIMKDGYITDASIMAALNDSALIGVDVINMSIGDLYSDSAIEYIYDSVLENARKTGISVVASAGNNARGYKSIDPLTENIDYGTGGSPGISAGVTTVGSANTNNLYWETSPKMSYYSSWGIDGSLELKPEISTPGEWIYSAIPEECAESPGQKYDWYSGTSMASPYMAGAYAVARQYYKTNPYINGYNDYTGSKLVDLLENIAMNSAEPIRYEDGVPYSPRVQGAGLLNFKNLLNSRVLLTGNSGKAKVSLGEITDTFDVTFKIKNISASTVTFDKISLELLTDGYIPVEGSNYVSDSVKINDSDIKSIVMPKSVTVKSGQEYTFNAKVSLKSSFLNNNKKIFTNGFFIDGFITLESSNASDKNYASLPFTGFYGDWKNISIFDKTHYDKGGSKLLDFGDPFDDTVPDNSDISGTYLRLVDKNDSNKFYYAGRNNCDKDIADRKYIAYSNKSDYDLELYMQTYRAVSKFDLSVTDENNNKISEQTVPSSMNVFCKFNPLILENGDLCVNSFLDCAEGEYTITVGAYAVGSETVNDTLTLPVVIDNTVPEIKYLDYNETSKILTVTAKDNHYLSHLRVEYDGIFEEYAYNESEMDEETKTSTMEIYLSDISDPTTISVKVYDYAMNCKSKKYKKDLINVGLYEVSNVSGIITLNLEFYSTVELSNKADIFVGFYDNKSKLIAVDKLENYTIVNDVDELKFKGKCNIKDVSEVKVFIWDSETAVPLDNIKSFTELEYYLDDAA